MQSENHWDEVYRTRDHAKVSWYQPSAEPSLSILRKLGGDARTFIDVGGGASSLVDALLESDCLEVTVVDIAASALQAARGRLGERSERARWEIADITRWAPSQAYDVWHDRAVFHFLTSPEARAGYKRALRAGTRPESLVIIATFALAGPDKCSGLPVQRYSAETLSAELGSRFRLLESWEEEHITPSGNRQTFTWCAFRRVD